MEENAVDGSLVLQRDLGNLFRHSKHYVKIGAKCCRQHFAPYVLSADMWRSVMAQRLEAHAVDFETT
jgi:hypothetical protein